MVRNIFSIVSVVMTLCASPALAQQDNHMPIVKILEPLTNGKHDLNNPLHYRIKISDQEDGESEYDEIAANEVFLEVRYYPDAASVSKAAVSTIDPKGLTAMKKSNCFNCHAFNGKLIAPSFFEITKRYPASTSNIELLTKRIQEGSTGVWGNASMPTHTELTNQETRDMVNWILENAKNTNLNYYTGTESNLKLKAPDGANQKGAFLLSATYSDHGAKNNSKDKLTAKDVIVLYVK